MVVWNALQYFSLYGPNDSPKSKYVQNFLLFTNYLKRQIFVQKLNFDKILQFFSGNQSCQQLKGANPQHFHEFFTQIFFDNFSREIKVVNS